jgi:hypothetical protein
MSTPAFMPPFYSAARRDVLVVRRVTGERRSTSHLDPGPGTRSGYAALTIAMLK